MSATSFATVTTVISVTLMLLHTSPTNAKDDFEVDLLVRGRSEMMKRICPGGVDRCHCLNSPGTFTEGPFDFDEDPIQASLTHITCTPDICYCKDAPTIERDTLYPKDFSAIYDLCPRGEMDRCLCEDNTVVKFPFDPTTIMLECRPKRCKCKGDSSPKKLTSTGCSKGGMPWCRESSPGNISDRVCRNGDPITINDVIRYVNDHRSDCICADGFAPRCRVDGKPMSCPDGSEPDQAKEPWTGFEYKCDQGY